MHAPPTAPKLVFLHGPDAAGKFTIARELSRISGYRLFHNHLVVDMLLALFPFGSPQFTAHRDRLWMALIPEAIASGASLIFTFAPERSMAPDFPARLRAAVEAVGGRFVSVSVICEQAEIERRLESDSRKAGGKLNNLAQYRELQAAGAFDYPELPADLAVDSTREPAAGVAARIWNDLQSCRL